MKKIYTLVLFVITFFSGNAQIVNIPDANLKAKLLSASGSNLIASTGVPNYSGTVSVGGHTSIDTNNDGEIQVSEAAVIKKLNLTFYNGLGGQILDLTGLEEFTSLIYLGINNNGISNLNLNNPQLKYIECQNNYTLSSADFSQLPNLTYIRITFSALSRLDFSSNLFLNNCQLPNNLSLEYVFIKDTSINIPVSGSLPFNINNNSNLRYVCAKESEVPKIRQYTSWASHNGIFNNLEINTYCSFNPGGVFYTFQGNALFDLNNNGCDVLDIGHPNLSFSITNGTNSGTFISNLSGNYSIPLQAGINTIIPIIENPTYFNISPTSIVANFPTQTSPLTQDFCITANGIKNDLEITIIPIEVTRPGFDAHYKIIYKNKGNQIANGATSFSFDDTVMDLVSSFPIVDGSGTNSLNWNFTDLNPFETREIDLLFNINSPMETPPVNGGDDLGFAAIILPIENDEVPIDNHSQIKVTVVNSYDPNDKTCLEGNTISPEMVGKYVHYVIRFENTGTFAAENVVIADVIDVTKFEIGTLIPQSSSHDFFTRINGNKVEFIFENINLPFDDENNDGYVAFKIKTKPNLVLGDEFTNTASIYFDYNFPIITNTTSTIVEEPLSNQDFDFETNFTLYPNPTKDVLNIKIKSEIEVKSVSIYNTLGQIIMTTIHAENGEINVSNLQSGSYFIKVFTDKGSSTAKFIKK